MKVYICFSGEYEQRSVSAVFSSKEIADQHSDDVEQHDVWDRLPLKAPAFESAGVFRATSHRDWILSNWKREGDWHVKRDSFESDEYFLQWWSGEKISYWSGEDNPDSGIYIAVMGGSRPEVDKRFSELQAEVEAGRKPAPVKG